MAGPIRISILANGRQARREAQVTAAAYGGLGRSLVKGGAALGLAGLTAKAVQFAGASVSLEAKFSQTMNLIGASTKAPAQQLDALGKLALDLGARTSFSANEAADAMLELAKSGVSTADIMGGGVQSTLQLAAAGGTDLGTAATIASNAMNAFGISGKDAASVAAALAGGANASSASVESLGMGLSQVGPGAVNAGLSLQETVAALSAFDAAGVKGSDAGTSLKTMLTRLVPSTKAAKRAMSDLGLDFTKANGEFVPLTNVAQQLKERLGALSAEQRTTALATIFGSDATRAATVLFREGAGGLQKYIKATNDQNAAQEVAEARMSGTAGTLERLSGSVETAQLRLGQELAPVVQKVGDGLADRLVPAMDDTIDAAKTVGRAVSPIVPVLKTLGDVVVGTAGLIKDLPGPVKELGIQAGLAALVMPRLAGAVGGFATRAQNASIYARVLGAELRDANTRGAALSGGLSRLAGASRNLAGTAGLVGLSASAQSSNDTLRILGSTASGAALGFSLGGPWGAAAGAVGGLGASLFQMSKKSDGAASASERASAAAAASKANYDQLKGSLDGVTGSVTQQTRAFVLDELTKSKTVSTLAQYGISARTVVSAALGQAGASRTVAGALDQERAKVADLTAERERQVNISKTLGPTQNESTLEGIAAIDREIAARRRAIGEVERQTGLTRDAVGARRAEIAATADYSSLVGKIPPEALTDVRANGIVPTRRAIADLARQYRLTPKQIRSVIRATGVNATVRDIQNVRRNLRDTTRTPGNLNRFVGDVDRSANKAAAFARRGGAQVGRNLTAGAKGARANLGPYEKSVETSSRRAGNTARRGGIDIVDTLKGGTGRARANLTPFNTSISAGVGTARGTASRGGNSVGAALKAGVIAGFAGTQSALSASAAAAVGAAIAAARARAKIKSPSRETRKIGEELGNGLTVGMRAKKGAAKKGGAALAASALDGVVNGSEGVDAALERVTKAVEAGIKKRGKNDKTEEKRERAALKSLQSQFAALRANGKAQDAITQKLETQRGTLNDLITAGREYASGIKQAAVDYGSVVGLGTLGGGTAVTADRLVSQLQARAKATKDYAATVERLARSGLNRTTVQQLLDAGPEAGLATAQALASGGAATLRQVNALTAQIAGTGATLGEQMRSRYLQAGIAAQQGIVAGLTRDQRNLDAAARRIAATLTKSVKRALGIKSPSRVFRTLGQQTVSGLTIGLDDVHVTRAGAKMARDLKTGFGTPALDALAASSSAPSGAPQVVRIVLSAEQVSAFQRGKSAQMDLDVYHANGGVVKVRPK